MHRTKNLLIVLLLLGITAAFAQAPVPPVPAGAATNDALAETVALVQQLKSQLNANQQTIEQLKEQAGNARHSEEVTSARLKLIEMTLTERHDRELTALQASNRLTLTLVGTIAALGLLGMIVLAIFLFRATTKLAELPAVISQTPQLGAGYSPRGLLTGTTSAQASAQLLQMVGVLEQKFVELEHSLAERTRNTAGANGANGSTPPPLRSRVDDLLSRGQTLLNQDKAEEALACLEEAVAADPNSTEALVRRGKALEKLGRMEDALRSYDRALAIDNTLTIAYLGKGGVYNRLERFGDALECYERALKTQSPAAG